jgi:hypothetical protein
MCDMESAVRAENAISRPRQSSTKTSQSVADGYPAPPRGGQSRGCEQRPVFESGHDCGERFEKGRHSDINGPKESKEASQCKPQGTGILLCDELQTTVRTHWFLPCRRCPSVARLSGANARHGGPGYLTGGSGGIDLWLDAPVPRGQYRARTTRFESRDARDRERPMMVSTEESQLRARPTIPVIDFGPALHRRGAAARARRCRILHHDQPRRVAAPDRSDIRGSPALSRCTCPALTP